MSASIDFQGQSGTSRPGALTSAPRGFAAWRPGRDSAILLALFAMPVALGSVGFAPVAKLAYPAAVAILAFWLARRDAAAFIALVLWTIILSPGLRHFIDWYAGFSQSNPMMLAPYLAVFAAGPTIALHLMAGRRYAGSAAILLLTVISGLAMPILTGALQTSLLEAVKWAAPVCLAVFIWANADAVRPMRESAHKVFALALPAVAAYGIVQFVAILPWDAYFMQEAPITSIGSPEPFLVRVFATMNSPGSLAAMLATGTLLLLPRVRGLGWLAIVLTLAVLMLTSQRAAMGAFVVAFVLLVAINRDRLARAGLVKLAVLSLIAGAILLSLPSVSQRVLGTFSSVGQLEDDASAQQRLEQYENLPGLLDEQLYGRGLGWSTNAFYINKGDRVALDGGLIDIFVSLGVVGGLLYLAGLAALVAQGLRIAVSDADAQPKAELAAVVFGLSQLPFGGQHTSEHGLFLYLALGLLLARRSHGPAASEELVRRASPARRGTQPASRSTGAGALTGAERRGVVRRGGWPDLRS